MKAKPVGIVLGALLFVFLSALVSMQQRQISKLQSEVRSMQEELHRDRTGQRDSGVPKATRPPLARRTRPAGPSQVGGSPSTDELPASTGFPVQNAAADSTQGHDNIRETLPLNVVLGVSGGGPVRLVSKPGCKVTISGTSSIHDWAMESAIIKGFIQVQPIPLVGVNSSAATNAAAQPSSAQAGITIPVRSFKSGKASMDELFLEAMHANTHRDVNYNLLALTPSTAPSADKDLNRYSSFGTLTINGIERECTLEVALDQLDRGMYRFRGEHNLKMSDYGVIPPETRIPGLEPIATGDDVVVRFEWVVGPAG